jgi:hypothetical protein
LLSTIILPFDICLVAESLLEFIPFFPIRRQHREIHVQKVPNQGLSCEYLIAYPHENVEASYDLPIVAFSRDCSQEIKMVKDPSWDCMC